MGTHKGLQLPIIRQISCDGSRKQWPQEFLSQLDRDQHVGDMVDCTSYFELEAEEYKRKGVSAPSP